MNKQLQQWLTKANNRLHGTTKKAPSELFASKEILSLLKLPSAEFELESLHYRKVAKDCHVSLENNYYSVPSKYVAREVIVSLGVKVVKIYSQEELIATHARSKGSGVFTTNIYHYNKYKRLYPGNKEHDEKCKKSMAEMGSSCEMMLSLIKQNNKDWHRSVKGILSLRNYYSNDSINKACGRAIHYGINSYSKIKSILENNCYELPLNDLSEGGINAKFG